jgi:hypothetical protein
VQPKVVTPLYFSLFSIVLRIVFPLIPIVLAPALFLSFSQGLALQTGRIFHCRSPVFFSRPLGLHWLREQQLTVARADIGKAAIGRAKM